MSDPESQAKMELESESFIPQVMPRFTRQEFSQQINKCGAVTQNGHGASHIIFTFGSSQV